VLPVNIPQSEPSLKKRKRKSPDKLDDLESRYLKKVYSKALESASSPPPRDLHADVDPSLLQHETVTSTSTDADSTIFISNLPVKVLSSKPLLKTLKRLFAQYGAIKSLRFRSIAFSELGDRKVGYITKNLHPERDTLNAYLVYSAKESVSPAVEALNNSLWEGKHLRVDSVSRPTVLPSFPLPLTRSRTTTNAVSS
jgi:nucleolar protein 12